MLGYEAPAEAVGTICAWFATWYSYAAAAGVAAARPQPGLDVTGRKPARASDAR